MSDSDDDFQQEPKMRFRSHIKKPGLQSIPTGHCLMNLKWRNTLAGQNISKLFTVKYITGDLEHLDCQLGPHLYAVFLVRFVCELFQAVDINLSIYFQLEGDIISGTGNLKSKLDKCEEMKKGRPEISIKFLFIRTYMTSQYFPEYQEEIVLNNGHSIAPISHNDHIAQVLQQFQIAHNRTNPFRCSPKKFSEHRKNLHKDILLLVTKVPGLGEKKSRQLLKKFDSLRKISTARESDLSPILGPNVARGVVEFFRRKTFV